MDTPLGRPSLVGDTMYPPVSTAGADLSSRGTHRRDTVRHLVSRHTRKLLRRYAEAGRLAPLSEATKTRKRHNIDKILTERGYLRGHGLPLEPDATRSKSVPRSSTPAPISLVRPEARSDRHRVVRPSLGVIFRPGRSSGFPMTTSSRLRNSWRPI